MNRATAEIAGHAAELIPEHAVVLTHSASEAVFASLRHAREHERNFRVIATESRPECEGVELAARLRDGGIETEIIIDAAMAQAADIANVVFVGADSVSASNVVNKVGTRLLALAARDAGKPAYVLCPSMKLWDREAPPVEGFEATRRALFRAIITETGPA
jgi:translation initiation factor eIF-2B subunit delta